MDMFLWMSLEALLVSHDPHLAPLLGFLGVESPAAHKEVRGAP